jgi:hypothetical protein
MVEEPLSRWEIASMISTAVGQSEDRQDTRHSENQKKLDRLMYLIVGTLLTTFGGIITELVVHSMGK